MACATILLSSVIPSGSRAGGSLFASTRDYSNLRALPLPRKKKLQRSTCSKARARLIADPLVCSRMCHQACQCGRFESTQGRFSIALPEASKHDWQQACPSSLVKGVRGAGPIVQSGAPLRVLHCERDRCGGRSTVRGGKGADQVIDDREILNRCGNAVVLPVNDLTHGLA